MTTSLLVVGFAVLAGWLGQQLIGVSPALLAGVVALCAASTYIGSRLK